MHGWRGFERFFDEIKNQNEMYKTTIYYHYTTIF
jgi:hypothetical protein